MSSQNTERKCLGDVTNKVSAMTTGTPKISSSLQSMEQLEQKVLELNHRLDALGTKFESLISNVQEQNREVSRLMIPMLPSSSGDYYSSSTHHTPTTSSLDESRSMKEQVKRSILGADGYSIYRKTLNKPSR